MSSFVDFLSRKNARSRTPRSLFIIIGAGVEHGHTPNLDAHLVAPAKLAKKLRESEHIRSNADPEETASAIWQAYECARISSALFQPPVMMFAIGELARKKNIVKSIILNNYTLYLDRVIGYDGTVALLRNPILRGNQYHPDGYYSNPNIKSLLHVDFRPHHWVPVYTPHGSLAFATYSGCSALPANPDVLHGVPSKGLWRDPHIFRLPPFPVSSKVDFVSSFLAFQANELQLPTQFHTPTFVRQKQRPIRADELHETRVGLRHWIDWNDPSGSSRDWFKNEITGAVQALQTATLPGSSDAIWLLGFTATRAPFDDVDARVEYNEELATILTKAMRNSKVRHRIWATISQSQFKTFERKKETKPILRDLQKAGQLIVLPDDTHEAWRDIASDVLGVYKLGNLQTKFDIWKARWCRAK